MEILVISLVMILIAPAIYLLMRRYGDGLQFLDRLVFFVVAALVLFELLSHSFEGAGFWALGMAALGWLIPYLFEAHWHSMTERIHIVPIILVCVGIVIHGFIDGLAIASPGAGHAHTHGDLHLLPWAVVMHQLPFAVFIWWFLYPKKGWKLPTLVLSLLGLSCIVGYFTADAFLAHMHAAEGPGYNLFQALVAGSLLHLAMHKGHNHKEKDHAHNHEHGHHHHHRH